MPWRVSIRLALPPLLAVLAACEASVALLPAGSEPFDPPARYRLWWSLVESCAGRTRPFEGVRWYVLPGAPVLPNGAAGSYHIGTRQILLAESATSLPPLVRHEMLHAVLNVPGHPREFFLDSCNGIVSCDGDCGGHPDPAHDAPEILPEDVNARFQVAPTPPSASANEGAMSVIISITNPHPYDVWVRLSGDPNSLTTPTFGVIYDAGDPLNAVQHIVGAADVRYGLAGGETRRYIWESTALAGVLGVRAVFNSDTTARVVYTVSP